jgi:hypothetical integral membrane protein (TIGR02206 family)
MRGLEMFVPFSALHAAAVAVCALLVAAVVAAGRALAGSPAEATLRRGFAVFALCYWLAYTVGWNWNGIDVYAGLPLHLCDFNALVAPLALLTGQRWLRATMYFWTFTLTSQAFIQPELHHGPAYLAFWAFWAGHTIIMTSAVYDLVVLRFRPDWGDLGRAIAASAVYAAFILPVNLMLGTNYGFIGNPPPDKPLPPFIEAMGPWPGRAVVVMGMAVVGFLLALAPWRIFARQVPPATLDLDAGKRPI